jgi:hypothetical protein
MPMAEISEDEFDEREEERQAHQEAQKAYMAALESRRGCIDTILAEAVAQSFGESTRLSLEGIVWHLHHNEDVPSHLRNERLLGMLANGETIGFVHWTSKQLSIKTPHMNAPAVVACMYVTFLENEAQARHFWRRIGIADKSDVSLPVREVCGMLMQALETRQSKRCVVAINNVSAVSNAVWELSNQLIPILKAKATNDRISSSKLFEESRAAWKAFLDEGEN